MARFSPVLGKAGYFKHDTLTVEFGGELSKPHNRFTAKAIKVPDYKYTVREREDAGGGWYGAMEENEYTETNEYIIVRDGVFMGVMHPERDGSQMKSILLMPKKISKHLTDLMAQHNIKLSNQ